MRSQSEILNDLRQVECDLSPENLTCDGELSDDAVVANLRELQAERNRLVKELGREPTYHEIWGRD